MALYLLSFICQTGCDVRRSIKCRKCVEWIPVNERCMLLCLLHKKVVFAFRIFKITNISSIKEILPNYKYKAPHVLHEYISSVARLFINIGMNGTTPFSLTDFTVDNLYADASHLLHVYRINFDKYINYRLLGLCCRWLMWRNAPLLNYIFITSQSIIDRMLQVLRLRLYISIYQINLLLFPVYAV